MKLDPCLACPWPFGWEVSQPGLPISRTNFLSDQLSYLDFSKRPERRLAKSLFEKLRRYNYSILFLATSITTIASVCSLKLRKTMELGWLADEWSFQMGSYPPSPPRYSIPPCIDSTWPCRLAVTSTSKYRYRPMRRTTANFCCQWSCTKIKYHLDYM